jgi:hypothetical protein
MLTKEHPVAPKPTTLSPIAVLPLTPTNELPAPPKPTTLSTVTVVPVPKTSSAAIQPVASAFGAKDSSLPVVSLLLHLWEQRPCGNQ